MSIWFCFVNVSFDKENEWFPGDTGGFVNVVTKANNEHELIKKIKKNLHDLGFKLESCEDIELFESKIMHDNPSDDIIDLYNQAKISEEVFFGTFHTYSK